MKTVALAGAGFWLSGNTRSLADDNKSKSPNEKLNLAIIGCGGRARGVIAGMKGENFVALCDVDDKRAEDTYKEYPKAERFRDFRNLLDKMHKQDRRGCGQHARPYPRVSKPDGHADGQALLLRKTACSHRGRDAGHDRHGQKAQSGHTDGHTDPRRRQLSPCGRVGSRRGHRPGPRSPRLERRQVLRRHSVPPAIRPPPRPWTGIAGWPAQSISPTIRPTLPSPGAIGGHTAPVPGRLSAATTATWPSGL